MQYIKDLKTERADSIYRGLAVKERRELLQIISLGCLPVLSQSSKLSTKFFLTSQASRRVYRTTGSMWGQSSRTYDIDNFSALYNNYDCRWNGMSPFVKIPHDE